MDRNLNLSEDDFLRQFAVTDDGQAKYPTTTTGPDNVGLSMNTGSARNPVSKPRRRTKGVNVMIIYARFVGKAGLGIKTPRQHQSDAARSRALRRRRSADVGLFKIALPVYALADTLVAAGRITEDQMDDLVALRDALELAVIDWCGLVE
jgi:hypothetical protein